MIFFLFLHYSCATYVDHDEKYVQSISTLHTAYGGTVSYVICGTGLGGGQKGACSVPLHADCSGDPDCTYPSS